MASGPRVQHAAHNLRIGRPACWYACLLRGVPPTSVFASCSFFYIGIRAHHDQRASDAGLMSHVGVVGKLRVWNAHRHRPLKKRASGSNGFFRRNTPMTAQLPPPTAGRRHLSYLLHRAHDAPARTGRPSIQYRRRSITITCSTRTPPRTSTTSCTASCAHEW